MKHLLTIAAAVLFAVVSTTTVHAQAPAAKPAATAPKASAAPAAAPKPATTATAKSKAATKFTAAQIKDVQTGLQKQKLYTGKISGVWSAATVKAYKAWQKANNLTVDGVLTDDAIAKLKA